MLTLDAVQCTGKFVSSWHRLIKSPYAITEYRGESDVIYIFYLSMPWGDNVLAKLEISLKNLQLYTKISSWSSNLIHYLHPWIYLYMFLHSIQEDLFHPKKPNTNLKELSFCNKLKFSNPYIFGKRWCEQLTFKTWICWSNRSHLYINLACLSVCLFVYLYPINVKTAEPIGPKFFVGHHVTTGKVYKW